MGKPFKSIDEQIEILKERGMVIKDYNYASKVLSHVNYYRLSGYTLTLRKNNIFYNNVKLEQVMEIYNFDAELRVLLLYLLEYIEVEFRTHFGYYHSKEYGPLGYLDKESFYDELKYENFMKKINQLIEENEKNEIFVKHHNENYDGDFPCWVIVELMSFGCLSRGFKNLHPKIKEEICNEHYPSIPYNYIENWLQGFVILRNICAHRGRLYNRYITFGPRLSTKDKQLLKNNSLDLNKNTKQVFVYIHIMNKLIDDIHVKKNFINRLEWLTNKYSFVKLKHYGFPEKWREILN